MAEENESNKEDISYFHSIIRDRTERKKPELSEPSDFNDAIRSILRELIPRAEEATLVLSGIKDLSRRLDVLTVAITFLTFFIAWDAILGIAKEASTDNEMLVFSVFLAMLLCGATLFVIYKYVGSQENRRV